MAGKDDSVPGDEPFIRAGEFALGVLEGEERAAAQRDMLGEPGFAAAVRWWERRLGTMAEAAESIEPSPAVWSAIEAQLAGRGRGDAPATLEAPSRGPSGWSIATALSGFAAAAAALALYLNTPASLRQTTAPVATSSEQLIAQISDEESGRRLAGRIDTSNDRLVLAVAGLEAAAGKTPELWVIPPGGSPVSLGAIPQSGGFERALSGEERALLVEGATLAVTFEDDSGSRHTTPTMPILLSGALDQV